jgi:hypothetical protein
MIIRIDGCDREEETFGPLHLKVEEERAIPIELKHEDAQGVDEKLA